MTRKKIALIEKFLDGSSTNKELREIKAYLLSDDEFKKKFTDSCKFNGILKTALDFDCQKMCKDVFERLANLETKSSTKKKTIKYKKQTSQNKAKKVKFAFKPFIAVAATIAIISGIFFVLKTLAPTPVIAQILNIDKNSKIERDGKFISTVNQKEVLLNDKLIIHPKGQAVIIYADGTEIELKQKCSVIFEYSQNQGKQIKLLSGQLNAKVSKQLLGQELKVYTGNSYTKVVGTEFSLNALSDETRLSVKEGLVEFQRLSDQKTVKVSASHWISTKVDPFKAIPNNIISPAVNQDYAISEIGKLTLIVSPDGKSSKRYDNITNNMIIDFNHISTQKINFTLTPRSNNYDYFLMDYKGPFDFGRKFPFKETYLPISCFQDTFQDIKGRKNPNGQFLLYELKDGIHTILITPVENKKAKKTYKLSFEIINSTADKLQF